MTNEFVIEALTSGDKKKEALVYRELEEHSHSTFKRLLVSKEPGMPPLENQHQILKEAFNHAFLIFCNRVVTGQFVESGNNYTRYFFVVLRYQFFNYLRKEKRRNKRNPNTDEIVLENKSAAKNHVFKYNGEIKACILDCLSKLPEHRKQLITWCLIDELTIDEIIPLSKLINQQMKEVMTKESLQTALSKAKKLLRECLKNNHGI